METFDLEERAADPVYALGRLKLPKQVDVRSPKSRRDLASSIRDTGSLATSSAPSRGGWSRP